jgi:hypothetical protein
MRGRYAGRASPSLPVILYTAAGLSVLPPLPRPVNISHMLKLPSSPLRIAVLIAAVWALSACNPTYNWREVHGVDAPYSVTLPAKPASFSRPVNLGGAQVTMTMTAAEVDDVTFAVGTAELADAAEAQSALTAMKAALVKNIAGTIKQEKLTGPAAAPSEIAIEAIGAPSANTDGQPRLLLARFIAKDKRVYQVIVIGKEKAVSREAADTFFTSFKLS